eukprot:2044406-Rhodomonas_salina.2
MAHGGENLIGAEFSTRIQERIAAEIERLARSSIFREQDSSTEAGSPKFHYDDNFEADDKEQRIFVKEEGRKAKQVAATAERMAASARTTGRRAVTLATQNQVSNIQAQHHSPPA